MAAKLIFREKHVLPDGAVVEMVIWKLPRKTRTWPHGLKYRLYYGNAAGECLVRYDNERGKGDHRHSLGGTEDSYAFVDVETLMRDFLADVAEDRRTDK